MSTIFFDFVQYVVFLFRNELYFKYSISHSTIWNNIAHLDRAKNTATVNTAAAAMCMCCPFNNSTTNKYCWLLQCNGFFIHKIHTHYSIVRLPSCSIPLDMLHNIQKGSKRSSKNINHMRHFKLHFIALFCTRIYNTLDYMHRPIAATTVVCIEKNKKPLLHQ